VRSPKCLDVQKPADGVFSNLTKWALGYWLTTLFTVQLINVLQMARSSIVLLCPPSRVIVLAHHEIGMLGAKITVRYKTITDLNIGPGSRLLKGFCADSTCAKWMGVFF
jgi:hypothetical protein